MKRFFGVIALILGSVSAIIPLIELFSGSVVSRVSFIGGLMLVIFTIATWNRDSGRAKRLGKYEWIGAIASILFPAYVLLTFSVFLIQAALVNMSALTESLFPLLVCMAIVLLCIGSIAYVLIVIFGKGKQQMIDEQLRNDTPLDRFE
jgi:hypothetical protein